MTAPKVIVLILSYNGKHLLNESVPSYLANDYPNFEVIVIDNGSTDNTKEYVETNWPDVKVLRTDRNLKYAGGFNFGLEYAFEQQNADYTLITNNDVKADKNVLKETVKVAEEHSDAAFVTGKVYYYDHPNIIQTVGKKSHEKYWRGGQRGMGEDTGKFEEIIELDWCDDIFWLVSQNVYKRTGGYDTEFEIQAEDFDWQVRAKKVGFKIYYTPFAKIWHKDSITIGKDSPLKSYYNFRNPTIVHMKYREYSDFKYFFRTRRKSLFKLTIREMLRFRIMYVIKSWQGFISAIIWGIKNKRISFVQIFY